VSAQLWAAVLLLLLLLARLVLLPVVQQVLMTLLQLSLQIPAQVLEVPPQYLHYLGDCWPHDLC
jgi:hypothetical protein